ncbi:MAG: hypothetical protein ACLTK0_05700 [Anaerovoracaceae bacterium]
MSKKGKRLREFEKKNRAFSVRETKQKEYAPQENTGEVFDIERRSRSSSEKKEIKKKKKTVKYGGWRGAVAIFVVLSRFSI